MTAARCAKRMFKVHDVTHKPSRAALRLALFGWMLAMVPTTSHGQTPPSLTPAPRFEGTLLLLNASAELEVNNDEALASFYIELQDADLTRAQSQVNQRVADGVKALKAADPKAQVETTSYGSFPIYQTSGRKIVGWRVRQSVNLRTSELSGLPRTVAAGQQNLALGALDFRVSSAAREKLDAELIRKALAQLNARAEAAAAALGVPAARIRIEELNFGGANPQPPVAMMARVQSMTAEAVVEPQFDAGRSTQQLNVSARVRFLTSAP